MSGVKQAIAILYLRARQFEKAAQSLEPLLIDDVMPQVIGKTAAHKLRQKKPMHPSGKRKMSRAARQAISAAQKQRWAKWHKEHKRGGSAR